jgi:hypothetical protein
MRSEMPEGTETLRERIAWLRQDARLRSQHAEENARNGDSVALGRAEAWGEIAAILWTMLEMPVNA